MAKGYTEGPDGTPTQRRPVVRGEYNRHGHEVCIDNWFDYTAGNHVQLHKMFNRARSIAS